MKIRKPNVYIALLVAIYVLGQNILYLVPVNNFYNLLAYLLIAILTVYVLFILGQGRLKKKQYTYLMLCPLLLAFMATLVECILYTDTNFIVSIFKQIQWWIYIFVYFIVSYLLSNGLIKPDRLTNCFVMVGIIQFVIGIVQYILRDNIIFTYAPIIKRLGELRFYFPVVLMVFVFFWALNSLFKGNKKVISMILMIVALFEVIFVQQFRSTALGMIIATVIGFFIWRKVQYKKIIIFAAVVIAGVIFYLRLPFLQQSIEFMLSSDRSLSVRQYLINFILDNAKNRPLFGSGWVSSSEAYAYASTPYKLNINWEVFVFADGGIFSIHYSYGIFGVLWTLLLWWRMLKNGWRLIKQEHEYFYFLFPLYMLITMYIDIHWYIHDQFFIIALFCALSEFKVGQTSKKTVSF